MKTRIQAFKKKDLPSKFGSGVWTVASVKLDGMENPEYGFKLVGFSKDIVANLAVGQELVGYVSVERWTDKTTGNIRTSPTFNAVDASYLYDLILKIAPQIESHPETGAAPVEEPSFVGPDQDETPGW